MIKKSAEYLFDKIKFTYFALHLKKDKYQLSIK
jgi:hypothetical protein